MKLFELLRRKSRSDPVVVHAAGEILVREPQIFSPSFQQSCCRFVERVLALDGIRSIAVERDRSSVTVQYSPDCYSPAEILKRMAAALSSDAVRQPNRELQQLLQGLDGRVFTVFRDGDTYSTSPRMAGEQPKPARGLRRVGYLALAVGSFGMSIVGVLVPGIPTVPFVLLTSYYLVRSSPPLNERLLRSRMFGSMIRDWQEHGGMRPGVKTATLAIMIAMATASVLLADLSPPLLIVVALLICLGVYSILRLPTVPEEGYRQSLRGQSPHGPSTLNPA